MISGIGTDIIDIRRIEKCFERFGSRFENRIFTEEEIKTAHFISNQKKRIAFYAKRFAAKEAYAKALGTGIGKNISFKDVSIEKEESGKPTLYLCGQKKSNIHVSLSDDYPYAQAFVIAEK